MGVKILAYRRKDLPDGLTFYCEYCKEFHLHGRGSGNRVPHCWKKHGYGDDGYDLIDTGKPVDKKHKKTDFATNDIIPPETPQ